MGQFNVSNFNFKKFTLKTFCEIFYIVPNYERNQCLKNHDFRNYIGYTFKRVSEAKKIIQNFF